MIAENSIDCPKGWIFYDADCHLCVRAMRRVRGLFESRGYKWVPLQTAGTAARLGVPPSALETRMHVLTGSGRVAHSADALRVLCLSVWWLWPVGIVLGLPGIRGLGRRGYDWLARNRYCLGGQCDVRTHKAGFTEWADWMFVILLPVLAGALTWHLPAWVLMWAMAWALFAGAKWLTFRAALAGGSRPGWRRSVAYLLFWPGMDAHSFLEEKPSKNPTRGVIWGVCYLLAGGGLVWGVVPALNRPLLAGWVGMVGLAWLLHFGFFTILAWVWRRLGIAATPIMQRPLAATSLSEFWGKCWNTAFRDLVHGHAFAPVRRRAGARVAMMMVFLLSGFVHELVISLPARAFFGLPTLYFLLQGLGILFERSALGRRWRLGHGIGGWLYMLFLTAGPAFLLFHPPFVYRVVLPFLRALGAY